ncbi:MAG TPA: TetR/AcrR family transcriptional regulator [Longimicrobium sp.]|jgi:TetR/AcrR family transcriptional repressor of nem operon|uniref:TetR/AcrR family transcriptional regulator n=1 Tax=Longimicrobium sp. TaxID=2029185 RepID=UPI002EDA9EEF
MVRYPAGHKEKTREQIVSAAARAFREEGVDAVSVGELMGRAGLTHGGFYAHFRNKDQLVAEACRCALRESSARLMAAARRAPPGERLAAFIRAYASPAHRDDPGGGCIMPALAAELGRHEAPEVRAAFTESLAESVATLARALPEDGDVDRTDRALALMSGLAGAVMLARAVDDPALSDRILRASSDVFAAAFAGEKGNSHADSASSA